MFDTGSVDNIELNLHESEGRSSKFSGWFRHVEDPT